MWHEKEAPGRNTPVLGLRLGGAHGGAVGDGGGRVFFLVWLWHLVWCLRWQTYNHRRTLNRKGEKQRDPKKEVYVERNLVAISKALD